eukprot:CAMPEP_0184478970 /NCGR_PEP_ID=MMETSP0113_2-20130426/849_1 /TAXON_ID=91329 /ORGANISM="Norrisiella sphaerica, Strain BC52" /LENGTH=943 /DNA_ID=CAMNT_0026856933 /DNA_START=254 /DNA_END=3085 /DNA_ORIENTATION=+
MNGIFEVVVHFNKFKNIDLFRQGLYTIRATIHSKKPEDDAKMLPVGEGMPYYLLNEKKVHERLSQNKKIVYPSKISDSLRAFYSKTFRVQYVDQEVDLEDACLFRFERKAKTNSDSCYLALELLFAEYNSTDYAMRKEYPPPEQFEMVSLKWLTINKFKAGHGSGFYPATFDDSHFCLLDTMLHFMLIDYQFRQLSITWKPPPGSGKNQFYELTCKTFEDSLFPKNLIRPTGNAYSEREVRGIADRNHMNYVTRLISAYNSLARVAHKFDSSAVEPLTVPSRMLRSGLSTPPSPSTRAPMPRVPDGNAPDTATSPKKADTTPATESSRDDKQSSSGSDADKATDANAVSTDQSSKKKDSKPLPEIKAKKRFAFPALTRFSKRIKWDSNSSNDKKVCADVTLMLTKDIKAIAEQNFQLWNTFIRMIPSCTAEVRDSLHKEYIELLHERITCFVFREKFAHKDRWRCAPKDLFSQHARQATQVRFAWGQATMAKLVLEDPEIFPDPKDHVVVFEESFDQFNPSSEYKGSMSARISISNDHFSTRDAGFGSSTSSNIKTPASNGKTEPPTHARDSGVLASSGITPTIVAQGGQEEEPGQSNGFRAETDPTMAWGLRKDSPHMGASLRQGVPLVSRAVSGLVNDSTKAATSANDRERHSRTTSLAAHRGSEEAQEEEETEGEDSKHIIVFVHGYQGNSWDMRLFKNHLALLFPNHLFLLSCQNEGHTEGDIGEMGGRLAEEIAEFIAENCPLGFRKLSFVAHSLGGLIARAALARKELEPFHSRLHTFMSLASPHCGYMYSKNTVLDTGIWVLKKWSKSLCLTQLSMTDHTDHEKCFVYKLSQKRGLEYFKNCLLLASHQDYYSPFHSSRIELHHDALRNQKHGKIFTSMVQNLLKPLKRPIKRYNVSFVNKKTNLDSLIGRTAHILFLDNHLYMVMICHVYKHLFK